MISRLDFDAIMDSARKDAALSDFGDLEFVPYARRWLECAEAEGGLSNSGRGALEGQVKGWLVNRLRFTEDLKSHPEILDEVLREPVIITGLPRTGTTKMQRVIGADPGVQSLPFWRAMNLAPMPDSEPGQPDPRVAAAEGMLRETQESHPEFLAGHPMHADQPEEECFLMETSFRAHLNCARVRVPSYLREIIDSPEYEGYSWLKRCLQYVQWQRGSDTRPWVLKTPAHLGNLEKVFGTFPDAIVVHCLRDPVATAGSMCRIFELNRGLMEERLDLRELGQEVLGYWAEMQRRHMAARQDSNVDERVLDLSYDDINNDVMGVVRGIYERRGWTLHADAEQKMRGWELSNPQHQFGRHQYTLERYGLTADDVTSAWRDYIARFDAVSTP